MRRKIAGVPRIAVFAVALLALGVAGLLITIAWTTGRTDQEKDRQAERVTQAVTATGDQFLGCTDCHGDLDKVFKEGKNEILLYTHEMHFGKGVSDCAMCHPPDSHTPDEINKPTMLRCFVCHGQEKNAMAPGACDTCHPKDFSPVPESHTVASWDTRHGKQVEAEGLECLTCHKESQCANCHGVRMPHSGNFIKLAHAEEYFRAGAKTCEKCHAVVVDNAPDDCDECHHPKNPSNTGWEDYHPKVVKDDASGCFECHAPTTCARCHVNGVLDLSRDRALITQ